MKLFRWFILLFLCCPNISLANPQDHKIKVCHVPPGNPANVHTINIDRSALSAHLAHGDSVGKCVVDCKGIPSGDAAVDECGVCGGDNSSCNDCKNIPNGNARVDACGICDGNSLTCVGCDGVPNSQKMNDLCGVCGGDNSTCKDCAAVPNGTSQVDLCGVCRLPGDTALNSTCKDCAGIPNGDAFINACGLCTFPSGSFNDGVCNDCADVANGPTKPDLCGVCGGANSCLGCDGVPNSGKVVDVCNVCGGDGASCRKQKEECPLTHIDIDVSNLLANAKRLHSSAVKYSNRSVSCNSNEKKFAKKRISKSVNTLAEYVLIVNSLKLDVNLCPGECVESINKSAIAKLKRLAKTLYKYSSDAQHSARNSCKNLEPAVSKTKKQLDSLVTDINNCPTKVCN